MQQKHTILSQVEPLEKREGFQGKERLSRDTCNYL